MKKKKRCKSEVIYLFMYIHPNIYDATVDLDWQHAQYAQAV